MLLVNSSFLQNNGFDTCVHMDRLVPLQVVENADLVMMDTKLYIVVVSALMVPYTMVKSLKILAPFSAVANMINFVGFILIFVNLWQDLPATETRRSVAELENLPLFFGQVLFAFEGISLVRR